MRSALAVVLLQLVAGSAAGDEAAAPPSAASAPPFDATLGLPVRIGAPWADAIQQLFSLRCMPEDSPLFEAMDCRSSLAIGPFSVRGPEGDGLTVYSDDGATVTRLGATRTTAERHANCEAFADGVSLALTSLGITPARELNTAGSEVTAKMGGELDLAIDCQPTSQTLKLAPSWLQLVPGGICRGLSLAPPPLRLIADSAMTQVVHDDVAELGLACNRAGAPINDFPWQTMWGVLVAYQSTKAEAPTAPPDWVVDQIQGGLADARKQGAALSAAAREQLGVYVVRESDRARLNSLWRKVSRSLNTLPSPQHGPSKTSKASKTPSSAPTKHRSRASP